MQSNIITTIHSFLVPPGKHATEPTPPLGIDIPLNGKLYEMLLNIYRKSDEECNIPIVFIPSDDGKQENDFRNSLINLIQDTSLKNSQDIAKKLYDVTTNTSSLGLLFIMLGINNDNTYKCVISRFPAEQGITAEEEPNKLKVSFVERVFMKNSRTYKSVLYEGSSFSSDFWEGRATDKQINSGISEISYYWINGFLKSDFKTTPKEGTRRLANALKNAIKSTDDIQLKQELVSTAVLARNLQNKAITIREYCEKYNLSETCFTLIKDQLKRDDLLDSRFFFDEEEFYKVSLYKSVELDNGGTLLAHVENFDDCFTYEIIDDDTQKTRFTTEGIVLDTRIKSKN